MKLYKYRNDSPYTDDIFLKNELYLVKPTEFNDPFDCQFPAVFDFKTREEKLTHIKKTVLESLNDPNRQKHVFDLFNHFITIDPSLGTNKKLLVEVAFEYLARTSSNSSYDNNLKNVFYENTGISCFTTDSKNILMWSHYANYHKGLCIEFDSEKLQSVGDLYKVNYVSEFDSKNLKTILDAILMKSLHWKYEVEYRLVKFGYVEQQNNPNVGKCSLPKESITGIIFGCNVNADTFKKYVKLGVDNNPNVTFHRARQIQGKYELELIDSLKEITTSL